MTSVLESGLNPRKSAVQVVERLRKSGVMIERMPPSEITRTLTYPELSDMLDCVVHDIFRCRPEAFDQSLSGYMTPARLKGYLYIVALHHFVVAGVLTSSGAQAFPDATGVEVPVTLLAWLTRVGTYAEGDTIGRARYSTPTATAAIGYLNLTSGTPVESNLSLTGVAALDGITYTNTYNEAIGSPNTADTNTVIQNWNANSDSYSGFLRSLDYPTQPMWENAPGVPDGSFFAFPTTGTYDGLITSAVTPYFASPFIRWDVEIAQLYYYTNELNGTVPTVYQYPMIAPRMGVTMNMCSRGGTVASGSLDPYAYLKWSFCFVIRNNSSLVFDWLTVGSMRMYHGDKLSTFLLRAEIMDLRGYHETVARAILQLIDNGATYNLNYVMAAMLVHEAAMVRKIQLSTVHVRNVVDWWRYMLPSSADSLTVLAPIVQLINEVGPVVIEGNLVCPAITSGSSTGNYQWFTKVVTAFTDTTMLSEPFGYAINSASNTTFSLPLKASAPVTLNAAWVTAYGGLGNCWRAPYFSLPYFQRQLTQLTSSGVAYGKGELLFNPSRGPRGGALMFSRCAYSSINDYVSDAYPNGLTLTSWPIQAIASHVALSGADITLAIVLRGFWAEPSTIDYMKYVKSLNFEGANPFVDRYVSEIMSPGGVFDTLLAKEMDKMHSAIGQTGVMLPSDNMDQCLWGAIKGIAGTIAQSVQPAISAAAGIGCGAIPGIGQFAKPVCKVAAKSLLNYVADSARVSTNRQAHTPVSVALKSFDAEVRKAGSQVKKGLVPEERHRVKPIEHRQWTPETDDYMNPDISGEEYERRRRAKAQANKPKKLGKPGKSKVKSGKPKKNKPKSRKRA